MNIRNGFMAGFTGGYYQGLTLQPDGSWRATGQISVEIGNIASTLADAGVGLSLINPTDASAGQTQQYSPTLMFFGKGYNAGNVINFGMGIAMAPSPSASPGFGAMMFLRRQSTGEWSSVATLNASGTWQSAALQINDGTRMTVSNNNGISPGIRIATTNRFLVATATPFDANLGLSAATFPELCVAHSAGNVATLAHDGTYTRLFNGASGTVVFGASGTNGYVTASGSFAGLRFLPGAGSVSAPGFTFGSDLDTGMYLVSDGVLGITTAGVQRGAWSAPGAGETALSLLVSGETVQRVSVGANDSGGAGYRLLRVPNAA